MNRNTLWLGAAAICWHYGWGATARAADPQAPNLVTNGNFEQAEGDRPDTWWPERWGDDMTLSHTDDGRGGGKCVSIRSAAVPRNSQWMQNIRTLKPYSKYIFKGWLKTANVQAGGNGGVGFMLHGVDAKAPSPLKGTNDWTEMRIPFETGPNDGVRVGCFFGINQSATGQVWYDDISIEWVSSEQLRPEAAIDAARTGAPISKYIYGQFIEHLGRCVNGQGIWAEMIEDRKFYHPIGPAKTGKDLLGKPYKGSSPWRVIGGDNAVEMLTEKPYVGQFTPQVTLPGGGRAAGLGQGALGILGGKEYEGRIILAGDASASPIEVSLVWGPAPGDRQTVSIRGLSSGFVKHPLRFKVGASTDSASLEIVSRGTGRFRIGTLSLMPADHVDGMRRDTLELMKQLDSPVYRWPGGCFVGGYDWRDGIGKDRDKRPPRGNTHWQGIEPNDFGIDEFMTLCRHLKTEPYICVDTGPGTAGFAAQEVEYVNGAADTPMGRQRAANGHPEPYGCKFWAVGNEMFGNWQIGYMPLDQYTRKHNEVAAAMWKADPSIILVGVGEVGPWSETMLRECAPMMNHMSEHFYKQDWHAGGLKTHVEQIPAEIRRRVEAHREYRRKIPDLAGRGIQIVMDEWNYWYGPTPFGEIGTRYFLKDGLGIAAGLHEYFRQSDIVYMANYAQTVNVIGAIKTSKTAAQMETTGLVLQMYRHHFGSLPVAVAGDFRPLDIAAAWTADRRMLTVGVVNPTLDAFQLPIRFTGARPAPAGTLHWMGGPDPEAFNNPGDPQKIVLQSKEVKLVDGRLEIPPASACILVLPAN
jgi:alpha-N-arabinofuranosidase